MIESPWLISRDEIEIIHMITLEVVGEEDECYKVEMYNEDDSDVAKANILKEDFEGIPYSIEKGVCVHLVSFKYQEKTFVKICPAMCDWDELWKEK